MSKHLFVTYFKAMILGAGASLVIMAGPAAAQEPGTRADLEAQKAVLLTKADLDALLPGATNESRAPRTGSARNLTLMQGGRVVGRASGGLNQNTTKAEGKWNVSDEGRYCVEIDWIWGSGSTSEKWCASMYKLGNDYYAVTRQGADAPAWKQTISK